MYEFGTIVLVPFPFTDLSSAKVRPALIVSRGNRTSKDVLLCFITSKVEENDTSQLAIESDKTTGLKVRSAVRFDRIATLEKNVVLGELGKVNPSFLQKHKKEFYDVFGFG